MVVKDGRNKRIMSILNVLMNRKSFIKEDNYSMIDTIDIKNKELEQLEKEGYIVKLFNQKWIKKAYYRISK